MKIYYLKRKQFLPITLDEAWQFFSSPKNLARITPPTIGFKVLYISGDEAETYAGQIIRYRLKILPGVTVNWMTEITHVNKPYNFIDEQRFGPYALWHHQHHFREVSGGVEMTDELNYAIPYGFIGRLAHAVFVGEKVNSIFEYRFEVLKKLFPKDLEVNKTLQS
jgi:ligand-binding SRPBCC domain-containing protein